MEAVESAPASPFDFLFRPFTEVRSGEGATAFIFLVNAFLLVASYYLIKPVREALILTQEKVQMASYASAIMAVLLMVLIPLYGRLGARVNRMRLIAWSNGFFIVCLILFSVAGRQGMRIGIPYFIWLGICNNFLVAQFWAFGNDIYTEDQGKRLFPAIAIGSTFGGWIGALAAKGLIERYHIFNVLLIGAAGFALCTALTLWIDRRESSRSRRQQAISARPLGFEGAFQAIRGSRYLLLIAGMILLLNTVNTTGEQIVRTLSKQQAEQSLGTGQEQTQARQTQLGGFFADYQSYTNLLALLLQMFVAARLFKYIGVRGTIFILPVVSLCSYSLMALYPVLQAVRTAKIFENGTDYSLQNTARQALFLTTSREAKYKAKAAIDTFVVRAGDVASALIVFVGTQLAFSVRTFAGVTLVVVLGWLALTALLYFEHRRLERAPATQPA